MALLIKALAPKGSRVETVFPQNGKVFTLEELQKFVGGYIEALHLQDGQIMFLNEDGKSMGLPYNLIADQLAHDLTGIADWDRIVGDVIITTLAECNEPEPEEGQAA